MFAIINVKTGEFVYGTDYRYHPPHQRTSNRQMLTYPSEESARLDFLHRKFGNIKTSGRKKQLSIGLLSSSRNCSKFSRK